MMVNDILLEQIIEGALMASGQTLSVDRLQSLFDADFEPSKQRVLIAIERITEKCEHRGFELKKVATGYRFQVKQDVSKWIGRLWDEKPQRYSRALLETLSIIAYRQPVTRGEIENVRGVAVSSHITKTLVEREWIQVVGHRDVPGRPAMFATTKMFLDYFNLEALDQLPTLDEIQEISDANHALELEEKVEEGNFDFSPQASDADGSDTLESAAKDLIEADALVQAVEDAVFNKPAEDEEQIELDVDTTDANSTEVKQEQPDVPLSSIEQAEAFIAQADEGLLDNMVNEQVSQDTTTMSLAVGGEGTAGDDIAVEDMDDAAMAEATIARMIAEQEALLNEKSGSEVTTVKTNAVKVQAEEPVASKVENSGSVFDAFNETSTVTKSASLSSSVFDQFINDEDSGVTSESAETKQVDQSTPVAVNNEEDELLMAAMEEEMMAQLEAEQEALLTEQPKGEECESKTIADLASKFE